MQSAQKLPGCKKKVQPCLKWPVWKKLWNRRERPRNGCDGVGNAIIQINLCCLILASPGISTKFTWIVVIKFFPSTYTITAFSWLPLHFHIFFPTGYFIKMGCTFFYSQAVFEHSFCNIFTGFRCKQLARLPPSINTIMMKQCYSTLIDYIHY